MSWEKGAQTCMNSMGLLSPPVRDADTLVAGYALGTMWMEEERRGFEMTRDDIDTEERTQATLALADRSQGASPYEG